MRTRPTALGILWARHCEARRIWRTYVRHLGKDAWCSSVQALKAEELKRTLLRRLNTGRAG